MFDFSGYNLQKLNPTHGTKPLDFGGSGITGSINQDGRIVAINTYHPHHGYITLTSTPPFAEDQRYNSDAVRAFRRSLTEQAGYGLAFESEIVHREAYLIEHAIPFMRLTLANGTVAEVVTFVSVDEPVGVVQMWKFSDTAHQSRLTGKMWLQRSAYTQLTEGGVVNMPPILTQHVPDKTGMSQEVRNIGLNAAAHIHNAASFTVRNNPSDGSVIFDNADQHEASTNFTFHIGIDPSSDLSRARYLNIQQTSNIKNLYDAIERWKRRWRDWKNNDTELDLARRRALVYGMHCAIPIDNEAVCFITDHMLLPLSWNRDAYYVAMALMPWSQEAAALVRGHLIWMFERAERLDGTWGRAYTANGKIKDKGYQLDQQIFPLLELANYTLHTNDLETYEHLKPYIRPTIEMLLTRKHPEKWLFATEETPADDPIAQPYHFSSHVLLWRTLLQLAKIDKSSDYSTMAMQLRETIAAHFVTKHNDEALYAYAVDGEDGYHLYHDANDIPLALMPHWGFCEADDPLWEATVRFSWSEDNHGGVYDSKLGSVHTPAPWPLGDVQELLIARILGDSIRYDLTHTRIAKSAQWDGALPEAYNADDFSVVSRHWFAWTNAMLVSLDFTEAMHEAEQRPLIVR